jgi:ribosomal protein S18 acetylase RimI-like enzyme
MLNMNDRSAPQIEEIDQVTEALYEGFQRMTPQLSSNNPPPSWDDLEKIVNSPGAILYGAYHADFPGELIGSLTLILYQIPTGRRARIEDVIVDERARGRGIGEALTLTAVRRAFEEGAANVELTSNPARLAANRLYQRLGFTLRQTNVYRFLPNYLKK